MVIVYSKINKPIPHIVVRDGTEAIAGFKYESDALQFIAYKMRDIKKESAA